MLIDILPFNSSEVHMKRIVIKLFILIFALFFLCIGSANASAGGKPRIVSVWPATVTAGSVVGISGENFDPDAQKNAVYFGTVRAKIISVAPRWLVVLVPDGGTDGTITVETKGVSLRATSSVKIVDVKNFKLPKPLSVNKPSRTVTCNYGIKIQPRSLTMSALLGEKQIDSVVLTNMRHSHLQVVSVISDNPTFFQVTPTRASLWYSQSAKFYITFFAQTLDNPRYGNIIFTYSGDTPPDTVAVLGYGIPIVFHVDPTTLAFDTVALGESQEDSVIAINLWWNQGLTINVSSVVSDNPSFGVTPTSAYLNWQFTQVFHIVFSPQTLGAISGRIIFTYDQPGSPDTVFVTGTGIAAPLPIQLASSSANVVRGNDVEVTWKTVSETNNYGFEVYRERGERCHWIKVGFVEGHGTTLTPQSYSYIDHSVPFGEYSYQIKQIDLDGKSETFPTMEVMVGVTPSKLTLSQNYPNPFNPSTVIEFVAPVRGHVTMKVYNVVGQEVATLLEGNGEAGIVYTARFEASNLGSGVYFYRIVAGPFVETKKMLLLR
jgi:hypothetical protein